MNGLECSDSNCYWRHRAALHFANAKLPRKFRFCLDAQFIKSASRATQIPARTSDSFAVHMHAGEALMGAEGLLRDNCFQLLLEIYLITRASRLWNCTSEK